jgi:hypothetical protein
MMYRALNSRVSRLIDVYHYCQSPFISVHAATHRKMRRHSSIVGQGPLPVRQDLLQHSQGAIHLILGISTILSRGVEPLGPQMGVISILDRGVRHLSASSEVVNEEMIVVVIDGHNCGRCEAGKAASSCGAANMKSSVDTKNLYNWPFEGVSPKRID